MSFLIEDLCIDLIFKYLDEQELFNLAICNKIFFNRYTNYLELIKNYIKQIQNRTSVIKLNQKLSDIECVIIDNKINKHLLHLYLPNINSNLSIKEFYSNFKIDDYYLLDYSCLTDGRTVVYGKFTNKNNLIIDCVIIINNLNHPHLYANNISASEVLTSCKVNMLWYSNPYFKNFEWSRYNFHNIHLDNIFNINLKDDYNKITTYSIKVIENNQGWWSTLISSVNNNNQGWYAYKYDENDSSRTSIC